MKILEIRALQGANFWSENPVIRMVLDLEDHADTLTTQIPGFIDRLVTLIPSLSEHRCATDSEGGLLMRLREGSPLTHVIEHVAIELQWLSYMDAYYCKSYPTKQKGVHQIVFEYWVEEAGIYAGEETVRIVQDIIRGVPEEKIDVDAVITEIKNIRDEHYLGPSTMAIVDEARRRKITVIRLDDYNLVQLGEGKYQKKIQATLSSQTSLIAVETAGNKRLTKMILEDNGIPVPKGTIATKFSSALEDARDIGYPVVVKPFDGHHGKGVTVGVKNEDQLKAAFDRAKELSKKIVVEERRVGNDYRVLVIAGKFIAAAQRIPANVVGDGKHTIKELIDAENKNPRRGHGHSNVMTLLKVTPNTESLLLETGCTLDTILREGEVFYLERTANLSTGGTAIDVTHKVHSMNKFMVERVARYIGLDIAGIDIIAPTLETPITENGGAVIEVNAAPGIRMHLSPSEGKPRNVAAPIVDMLFPPGSPSDIPIVSVTGTNGKTTAVRLIAHIMKNTGKSVGMTCTDGIYVRDRLIIAGDMSGPRSARMILQDPTVDCAVFETARGGLLRNGLGYGTADVGICLNVTEDHIGLGYIETIEDLAKLKSIVPSVVRPGAYSVLNADDKWCRWMQSRCKDHVVWFSVNPENPTVKEHVEAGGLAVVYQNGYITILEGDLVVPVAKAYEIPITMEGKAGFNIQNAMAATAAAYALHVKVDEIRLGLSSFFPSPSQAPGRMNILRVRDFDVLIDYAHNPFAVASIFDLISRLNYKRRLVILDAVGDRRDEDITQIALTSAKYADEVILYEDKDLRGRKPGEILKVLRDGFASVKYPADRISEVPDEWEALDAALKKAEAGDLMMYMTGRVRKAISVVYEYKEKFEA
ncbi:MAG: cyanophycin synthetase [Acidobacteriota bacterium]